MQQWWHGLRCAFLYREQFKIPGGPNVKEQSSPCISLVLGKIFASTAPLVVAAALAILFMAQSARAQDTGYISGTVTDKSGAAVVDAEVVITSTGQNLTRNTTTNSDGAYVGSALPAGTYDIVVSAQGFQKFEFKGVVLDVAQKLRVDVSMTVGAMKQEIVVTGENVAEVETQSSELGGTITGKQIDELMLNGRNFTQLATLTPGVVNQGPDEAEVGVTNIFFSVNGGREEYNNWELDGGDNMDNGSNATLNVYPSLESIAEFKVLTSNYGAQYGRNASGTIEVETKSGTNTFHGSAYYYGRNEAFNARSWDQGIDPTQPKALYRKHDFGYTIGGPVYIPNHYNSEKKKTFFFWSQEWRREKNPSTITQDVPSDAERGLVGGTQTGFGNFSDVCPGIDNCPNVANPAQVPISSVGLTLMGLIPRSNTTNGGFPAVTQTISPATTWREQLIRLDHNLTDNYRLTFRYIHDSWQTVVPNPLWGNGNSNFQNINTSFVGPGTSFIARLTANITPTLLNEFVASYTADHIFLTALNNPPLPSDFAMGSLFANGFGGKLPSIQLQSNPAYGGSFGQDTGYFPWVNSNPTYTYRDNVTKVLGTHTFQFGAYAVFAQKNEANSPDVQGILTFDTTSQFTTGNAFADLLLGKIGNYKQWSAQAKYYNRYKIVEPYFQDDWRVTKRLTLNLGLRVSLFGTYREKYRQAFNFDPSAFVAGNSPAIDPASGALIAGTGNPFNGVVQCGGAGGTSAVPGPVLAAFPAASVGASSNPGCLKGHLFNPAPRVGFAFDPKGDGKTAIRGGYGIFYEHTNGNEGNSESLEGSAPLVITSSQNNIPDYASVGAGGGALFPLTLTSIPNKALWPYMQQWNLSVQRELPSHIIFSAAYVGSKGTHLTLLSNGNQILPLTSGNPYKVGEPITGPITDPSGNPIYAGDCSTLTTFSGVPITGQALNNLNVACGANADALRTNFPGFSNINSLRDVANSSYHAFQTSANRTVGALTVSVAYTYSHSIDDSSDRGDSLFVNAYNIASNRASSSFDLRHNLSISYVYGLPFFKGSGLTHSLLGGWQVSGITVAQSGLPFTVTNGTTYGDNAGVGNGVGSGSRPDQIGNPAAVTAAQKSAASTVFGPLYYNPAAYALPTGLTFGNVGRNTLNLPGRLNFDAGLFKQFPIRERMGFQFRWEVFNVFNHTQYNSVSGNNTIGAPGGTKAAMDTADPGSAASLGSSSFLHLTGARAPRIMQLGLRFQF
jgi:Carboxypeptidase regulatory-like domain